MNKRLQNNRRLHWQEWACNHNHAATLPTPLGPQEVGKERRRGRKTLGQPCWAGRKARCILWPRAPGTKEWSQPAWEKLPVHQAALPCAADPLQVPSSLLKIPRGSRCGEAGAGVWAGAASSDLYLQFRWDPLQRKRLDKEAPSATQPHPNGTMPHGSPAPQAHCSATVLLADRGAAKRCACQCPQPPVRNKPRKGLHGPFLAGASPQGEAESVPPSHSPRPQLAHGPGEGGKGGRKDEPEPTQDRTWHSAPGEHKPACRSVDLWSESRIQI